MVIMDVVRVVAEDAAASEGGTPPYVFGLVAFGTLAIALWITTLINVNR